MLANKDFSNITFRDFKLMAKDDSLSKYEKIGFPDSYREGYEEAIVGDIFRKLPNLSKNNQMVMDIGPGVSDVPQMLIALCEKKGHTLLLVDSQEMLDHLPDKDFIRKIPCYYPYECKWLFDEYKANLDVILVYSVLHYIYSEMNPFHFLDKSLGLLGEGGQMLIGDIPNLSQRKRFFSSPAGIKFHKKFMNTDNPPDVRFNTLDVDQIDDAILLSIVTRTRSMGFNSYVLPQPTGLPMANRREDILIVKP
jgi:hypothetical protein